MIAEESRAARPRSLVLVLHNHQPVGNFEHVFEDAYRRCYDPVTSMIARHPNVKVGLHFSGPLLEWIKEKRGAFFETLAGLIERGQIELLGGAFYEPILSVLPDDDAIGQLEMMGTYCERYFGKKPEGIWLAERVWDPDLPRVLARAGIRYTLLDDTHFRAAGIDESVITGHYVTEKAGHPLSIFPIDKGLRYRIPFAAADEVVDYIAKAPGKGCLTYGDDGEKFGLWPKTHEWVFEKGWLNRFFEALERAESNGTLVMRLPSDARKDPPEGRVYLPNASYEEMMEWALPVEGTRRLHALRERFKQSGEQEIVGPYLRGGIWQSFLSKYSEANQIHKKMLRVSSRLHAVMAETHSDALSTKKETSSILDSLGVAQRELYKGQCCCAYWHGLFGGLYLNYLRSALYRSLLASEQILDTLQHGKADWLTHEQIDHDLDGRDEIVISNRFINVYVRPHVGASVFELDFKPRCFNVTDVLTRREESYHQVVLQGGRQEESESQPERPKTIHEVVRVKEEGLDRVLRYDDAPRATFVDRFLPLDVGMEEVQRGGAIDRGDFAEGVYQVESLAIDERGDRACHLHLWRTGAVRQGSELSPLTLEKHYLVNVDRGGLRIRYVLRNDGDRPIETMFASEMNLTLLAGNDPLRYVCVGSGERTALSEVRVSEDVTDVHMVDEWSKLRIDIRCETSATLFRYPIETVSQSESGLERTYQGTCLLPAWRLSLAPRSRSEVTLTVLLSEIG